MDKLKFEKVNERRYNEPLKSGGSIDWNKRFRILSLTCTDIRVELELSIQRGEAGLLSLREYDEANNEGEKGDGLEKTTKQSQQERKYSESFGWRIKAIGHFDNRDRVGLIRNDGTISERSEDFHETDVFLRPVSDSEKETVFGHLFYDDAEYNYDRKPHLNLDLHVPEARLEKLCNEILSNRLTEIRLQIDADLFQSGAEELLSEPWMSSHFLIEEENYLSTRVYLSWLAASRSITGETSRNELSPDNPRELIQGEGISEQKVDDRAKYTLAWKLFGWIFR